MNKNLAPKKTAFSMIELAVVIIIIGILAAAVIKGSKVLKLSKLTTARTATNSSAVHSISGLSLWLETSLEESFLATEGAEGGDGSTLTKWIDINSQSIVGEELAATGTPTYDEDGINGRPAIDFSGGGAYFSSTNFKNVGDEATFFLVLRTTSLNQQVISKSPETHNANTNLVIGVQVPAQDVFWCFSNVCGTSDQNNISANNSHVISFAYQKDYSGSTDRVSTYVDSYSISQNIDSGTDKGTNSNNLTIGKGPGYDFTGRIGEVIIFDKKLNSDDHRAVMKYLGKKWGINISE